jgi:hypothetical protein
MYQRGSHWRDFCEICIREIHKIVQKYLALYVKTLVGCIVADDIKSQRKKRSF